MKVYSTRTTRRDVGEQLAAFSTETKQDPEVRRRGELDALTSFHLHFDRGAIAVRR